jgi:hypothetical protein
MSGFAPEGLVSFQAGVPLLRKPFSLDALRVAVRDSLNNRSSVEPSRCYSWTQPTGVNLPS